MTNHQPTDFEQRLAELERRLEEFDDVVAERCLAVMDVADELYRRSLELIERNSATIATLIDNANIDRAQMLENQAEIRRIWEYLLSTRPNGRGEQGGAG